MVRTTKQKRNGKMVTVKCDSDKQNPGRGCTRTGDYKYGQDGKPFLQGTKRRYATHCAKRGDNSQCSGAIAKSPKNQCTNCGGSAALQIDNKIYFLCYYHSPSSRKSINIHPNAQSFGLRESNMPGATRSSVNGMQRYWKRNKKDIRLYEVHELRGIRLAEERGGVSRRKRVARKPPAVADVDEWPMPDLPMVQRGVAPKSKRVPRKKPQKDADNDVDDWPVGDLSLNNNNSQDDFDDFYERNQWVI